MGKITGTLLKEGKYLYCIIESAQPCVFGPMGIGSRGDDLYTICFKALACVVSDSPIIEYSVSRQNLLAHEKAIEEAMRRYVVLPVRFGTIAGDEEKVTGILEREYERFKELLERLKGKEELGVKAIFKEDIFRDILEKDAQIRALKDEIQGLPVAKTYFQRMEIGRMVEAALEREKQIYREDILRVLSPLAVETKLNSTYGERMIVNSAFLVERQRKEDFQKEVQGLDVKCVGKVQFKYVEGMPPFNFVNLVIETGKY